MVWLRILIGIVACVAFIYWARTEEGAEFLDMLFSPVAESGSGNDIDTIGSDIDTVGGDIDY